MAMVFLQLRYYLILLALLPLTPVLLLLGKRVRSRLRLSPEARDISGTTAEVPADLRVLILGESTMAGVGAQSHETGFAGRLAYHLQHYTGQQVSWQVAARSGYTTRKALRLVGTVDQPIDLVFIGLGANDAFRLQSPLGFTIAMRQLLLRIQQRYPGAMIIINNLPPVASFPGLPVLLRFFPGRLIPLYRSALRQEVAGSYRVHFNASPIQATTWLRQLRLSSIEDLFSDGIHPNGQAYDLWAQEMAAFAQKTALADNGGAA